MSITRHEIRKITDENRGQPIISQAVVHGNVAVLFYRFRVVSVSKAEPNKPNVGQGRFVDVWVRERPHGAG